MRYLDSLVTQWLGGSYAVAATALLVVVALAHATLTIRKRRGQPPDGETG